MTRASDTAKLLGAGATISGDIDASTINATGDTAAGDNAAIGFTSAEGLILTGQGSTSDITVKNDADATVFTVPTGTDDILFPDNAKIKLGASADLQIYHNASNSYIQDVGTGKMHITSDGTGVSIDKGTSENMATFDTDGAVSLFHNAVKKFETTSTGVTVTGGVTTTTASSIEGGVVFNEASADVDFRVESNAQENMLVVNGGHNSVQINTNAELITGDAVLSVRGQIEIVTDAGTQCLEMQRQDAGLLQNFRKNGGSSVGNITISATATAFNTSSDYRLKENVVTSWDATTRLKQLKPSRFNFIADADTTVDGFLAHEVQSVVPEAITGTHNEVDDDGNPVMQGIDQSKLVPLLVKTIQELEARITTLENGE